MAGESTFLLGNGIGRAVDNNYFNLEAGIQHSLGHLPDDEKVIIEALFSSNRSENALETHHSIANSCRNLIDLEINHSLSYINDNGKNFPTSFYNFIYLVAKYFWEYPMSSCPEEFSEFIDRFSNYIKNKKSNVATLNYDKLIYFPFVNNKLLAGYSDGRLIDGILTNSCIFEEENFITKNRKNLGYYLHLHGSPVIYMEDNKVGKVSYDKLPESYSEKNGTKLHNTIVLSHANLKRELIINNKVLKLYFTLFKFALSDSDKLCIIGYGGDDKHVNETISDWIRNKVVDKVPGSKIIVVSHAQSAISENEWKKRLYPIFKYENFSIDEYIELHYQVMDNILEFDFQL